MEKHGGNSWCNTVVRRTGIAGALLGHFWGLPSAGSTIRWCLEYAIGTKSPQQEPRKGCKSQGDPTGARKTDGNKAGNKYDNSS